MIQNGQIAIIVGATGGLGKIFAQALALRGAKVVLAARNQSALNTLQAELNGDFDTHVVELTSSESLNALRDTMLQKYGRVDLVINATGVDVRKPLELHSDEDIQRSLDVNLRGAILLTRVFVPMLKQHSGMIVHVGGFADGRLAFPYYSVDVATRAGLFSFIESINRELRGSGVTVSYFSPSPTDTEAERPYHAMWQQMGIAIVPAEKVATALLKAIEQRKTIYMMGGLATVVFARLNSVFPRAADWLVLNSYAKTLRHFLLGEAQEIKKGSLNRWFGIALITFSFALYAFLPVIPFLSLANESKIALSSGMIALSEVAFWVGGMLVGKELVSRFRHWLNPCNWCTWQVRG